MQVDMYSTYSFGGAATAARRLHDALIDEGVSSRFRYSEESKEGLNRTYQKMVFEKGWQARFAKPFVKPWRRIQMKRAERNYQRYVEHRPAGFDTVSIAELNKTTPLDSTGRSADLLHLHWIAFALDYASFFRSIPWSKPVVWTLHDMNPFTGACHYSSGCRRFQDGCGQCPQLTNPNHNDLSAVMFRLKKKALSKINLHIVTPSRWLLQEAQASALFPAQTTYQTIPYGLDLNKFKPVEKKEARMQLGLPIDGTYFAFGAEDLSIERKGFQYLLDALPKLGTTQNLKGIVFGNGKLPQSQDGLPQLNSMGYVSDPQRQALIYSAADMFILPSLEDNSPQTGIEALACGTPVIAFDTGGIPEYVLPMQTGLLAELKSSDHLAAQIRWLSERPNDMARMSTEARDFAEQQFDPCKQAARYMALYGNLLSQAEKFSIRQSA